MIGRILLIIAFCVSMLFNLAAGMGDWGVGDGNGDRNGPWAWASGLWDWRVPLAFLLGWFIADMASGIIHMVMDYWPCRPGVGLDRLYFYPGARDSAEYQALFHATMARLNPLERLVYDFKNHHPRPGALGRRNLWQQIGSTIAFVTLPLSLMLNVAVLLAPVPPWAVVGLMTLLLAGTFAQYFHGTLHREDNPWVVRAMRKTGLLMTPAAHDLHHATLTRDFSTNCGWSNPVLNRIFAFAVKRGYLKPEGLEPVS